MDKQELKKLKMHLQGALDCLAKYEMEDSTTSETDDMDDDDQTPEADDSGLKSMKMKLLGMKNKG